MLSKNKKTIKKLLKISLIIYSIFFLVGCSPLQKLINIDLNSSSINTITFSSSTLNLNVGDSDILHPTFTPKSAKPALIWQSSNSNIVNVSANGEIIAISTGTATIMVKSALNSEIYANCSVLVANTTEDSASINNLKLIVDKKQINIKTKKTLQIRAKIFPFEFLQNLLWKSSNPSIVSVSDNGTITAHSKGQTVITIKSEIYNLTTLVKVFVDMPTVQNIAVNAKKIVLEVNQTKQLSASVLPENAAQAITYVSIDTSIATITTLGVLKAKAVGTTTIKVKSLADQSKYTNIEIFVIKTPEDTTTSIPTSNETGSNLSNILLKNNLTEENLNSTENINSLLNDLIEENTPGITINNSETTTFYLKPKSQRLVIGEPLNVIDYILPKDVASSFTFSSSDSNIVSVNNNGLAQALNAGLANITINSPGTNQVLSFEILVSYAITSVSIDNGNSFTLTKGDTNLLTATISPSKASQEVSWKSSNTSVIEINQSGQITAVSEGSAVITATSTAANSKTAYIEITVIAPNLETNNAPQIYSEPELTAIVNIPYIYQISVTDYEDNPLTYQIISKPAWLIFDEENKILYGTPTRANVADSEISIKVSDGVNETIQNFTLSTALKSQSYIGEWLATEGDFVVKGINCVNKLTFKFDSDGKIIIRHLTLPYNYISTWEALPGNKVDIKETNGTSHIYNVLILDKDNLSLYETSTGKSRIFKKY